MTGRSAPSALLILVAAAGIGTGVPAPAAAGPSKQQCVNDNASAQELRRQGRFADASTRLQSCAVQACPAIVREDCTRQLEDLRMAQPSLVFDVRAASGTEVNTVRVSVDGQRLTDRLDGTALKVDPGPHAFTFELADQPAVTRNLVVKEGEAARYERIVVGSVPPLPLPATPPSAGNQSIAPPGQSQGRDTRQTLGLSAAGLGAVGAVIGTVFGLKARSAWTEAKSACGGDPGRCADVSSANARRSQALSDGAVSTTAFIAGGVLVAGGALLYLTGGDQHERKPDALALSAAVEAGRLGIVLWGGF